ncbi:MAG: hypothetical protein E7164_03135 [Firmicutes bacterium]|nr:hypothetical protein [Bacillota bacterium]
MMDERQYEDENTIIELTSVSEDTLFEENAAVDMVQINDFEMKTKKKGPKKEFFWNKMSKKSKIITIISIIFILLIALGVSLYLLFFNKEEEKPKPPEESVVIEKDNYIYDNGSLKLLNNKDEVIGIYSCTDKEVEKCYVASLSNEDEFDTPIYVDEEDNLLEKKSKIYNNRFVFIYDEDKIVLYDLEKETKTGEYSLVKSGALDKDIVVVKNQEEKYGLIEFSLTDANTVLEFEYDYLGIVSSDSKFVAKDGTYSYLVDKNGNVLTSKIRGNIRNFSDKYISVYDEGYSLYDYQGQKILEDTFDYIDFASGYVFTITNKKVFAYDSDLFKLNETGIKVKNEEYNKTYIFDANNNLKETKKAYNITFTTDEITFELSDETEKSINLNEARLNKEIDYVSYYDGILYFYQDLDKKELLGSYSCTNKNKVTSTSESFTTCFVAKDSNLVNNQENLYYIPIINDNYVFIYDTKEGATKTTIVLYDLANSSQKVKYQAVDTGISSEDITFVTSQNALIYAKNTEGNLGAITFGADGPEGLIPFKVENEGTKSIGFLDDYLLVKRGSKNYLYTKIGKLLATSQFEIIKYRDDYLLVKDKKYLVYELVSNDSGVIISEQLDHIELFDTFFVGVTGKKLNVYQYDDGKTKLLEEDLEILSDKISEGYKMAIHSDSYVISIVQSDNATIDYKYNLKDWSKVEDETE